MNGTLLSVTLALATSLAPSKIGIVELGSPIDTQTQIILATCPRVAKWVVDAGNPIDLATPIATFKSNCLASQRVVQVKVPGLQYSLNDDAAAKATDFWTNKMLPALTAAGLTSVSAKGNVNWFEGPAPENLPEWWLSTEGATWYAAFWSKLFDLMYAGSYWPIVGPLKAGLPALADDTSANRFCATVTAIRAKNKSDSTWAWGYQVWSTDLGIDASVEATKSLGYRRISQACSLGVAESTGVTLILTEGGQAGGWKNRQTTSAYYLRWLRWLDNEIAKDKAVRGFTLFQMGERATGAANAAYDVTAFAAELKEQMLDPERCDAGPCSWDTYDAGLPPGSDGSGGSANPNSPWKPNPPADSGGCQSVGAGLVLLPILALVPALLRRRRG